MAQNPPLLGKREKGSLRLPWILENMYLWLPDLRGRARGVWLGHGGGHHPTNGAAKPADRKGEVCF